MTMPARRRQRQPGSPQHLARRSRARKAGHLERKEALEALEALEAEAGCPVRRPLHRSAELPRAARRALRRHRSRAGALPR